MGRVARAALKTASPNAAADSPSLPPADKPPEVATVGLELPDCATARAVLAVAYISVRCILEYRFSMFSYVTWILGMAKFPGRIISKRHYGRAGSCCDGHFHAPVSLRRSGNRKKRSAGRSKLRSAYL